MKKLALLFLALSAGWCAAQSNSTLTGKTNFDCLWNLDGKPQGELKAGVPKTVHVSSGNHKIEAATADGLASDNGIVDAQHAQETFGIVLKINHDLKIAEKQAIVAHDAAEADIKQHPTWTDPSTGFIWARRDNGADVDWQQAYSYCQNLRLAGLSRWRLPEILELLAISDDKQNIMGWNDWSDTVFHVKGALLLSGWTWSNTAGQFPGEAGAYSFYHNKVNSHSKTGGKSGRALCVRGGH